MGITPKRIRITRKEILEDKEKSSLSKASAQDPSSRNSSGQKRSKDPSSRNSSGQKRPRGESDQVRKNLIQDCDKIRQRSKVAKMEKAVDFAVSADCTNKIQSQ